MVELFIIGMLNCPMVVFSDDSGLGWNIHDERIYRNNSKSCQRIFGKEWKCLKRFIKRDAQVYWVTCVPELKTTTKGKK